MKQRSSSMDRPTASISPSGQVRRSSTWFGRLGPGLITASVVIGPGSILLSSQAGASFGFSLSWVVLASAFFMMIFTTMASTLAVVAKSSLGDLIRQHVGAWVASVIGVCVFLISAAFQSGNNLGLHSAIEPYVSLDYRGFDLVAVAFNGAAIAFLFSFNNLYRALERLMKILVGLMLLSFAVNLLVARPDFNAIISDLVQISGSSQKTDLSTFVLTIIALTGTTFVISAAYFQGYVARQKGWKRSELATGLIDARIGSVVMALMTLMIMWTAATVLRGSDTVTIARIADQLEPLFGGWGKYLFSLGLFAASFSSFIVNSMIGGFVVSDGFRFGSDPTDIGPKIGAIIVLLTGMVISQYTIVTGSIPLVVINVAQAVTVITAPLVAGILWWLANRPNIVGNHTPSIATNLCASIGILMLLIMSGRLIYLLMGS